MDPPGSSSTQADLHQAYKDRFEAEQDLNPTGQRKRVMHTASWKAYVEKARYLGLLEVVGEIPAVTELPDAMAYLLSLTPAGRRSTAPWDHLVRAFSEAEEKEALRGPA